MRVAVEVDWATGGGCDLVDDRRDVLVLALDGVVGCVAAGASASPVDGMDGEVGFEVGQQRSPPRVIGGRAVDHDQRWPVPVVQYAISVPSPDDTW